MTSSFPEFELQKDNLGLAYISASKKILGNSSFWRNRPGSKNIASFLAGDVKVSTRFSNQFSTDLTSQDDILLAIVSLLLILVIEAIIATIILRTRHGPLSTFAFSVKHFLDLVRDFRFLSLLRNQVYPGLSAAQKGEDGSSDVVDSQGTNDKKLPSYHRGSARFLLVGSLVLMFSLIAEVLILLLTAPTLHAITNSQASVEVINGVNPDWNVIRDSVPLLLDRPCREVRLVNVRVGLTRINACVTSSLHQQDVAVPEFEQIVVEEEEPNVTIISDVHEFGAEHELHIERKAGTESAFFSSRVDFRLADGESRLMRRRSRSVAHGGFHEYLHKQLMAYMYSIYERDTRDILLDFKTLHRLDISFKQESGPPIEIFELSGLAKGQYRTVGSVRHETKFQGLFPYGPKALRFAHLYFKASSALRVIGPGEIDLMLASGNSARRKSVVWWEEERRLNWLSLLILLLVAVGVLVGLRMYYKPTSMSHMAGRAVLDAVGGRPDRSPMFLDDSEKRRFAEAELEVAVDSILREVDHAWRTTRPGNSQGSRSPRSPSRSPSQSRLFLLPQRLRN